jgi:hypothetical protein
VRYKPVVVVVVVVVVGKRTRARTRNIDIRDYSSPERAGGGVREEEAGRGVPGFEIAFCRCNRGADFKPTDSRGPRDGRIARNLNSARRLAVPFPARGGGEAKGRATRTLGGALRHSMPVHHVSTCHACRDQPSLPSPPPRPSPRDGRTCLNRGRSP